MAKSIAKENYISSFNLIGKPIVTDYTFKIDQHSEKSDWIYSSMNLGIDCGEEHGTVYAEMMGGYPDGRASVIYAHGKDDDGKDDFSNKIEVAWEDRFDDEIIESIGDMCFITVGLEKTDKGNNYYEKFLSQYDAIAYIKEHITSDSVVNVRGNLKYSTYNDNVQVRKEVTSIVLSKVDDPSKYAARFTQTVLLDQDSASLKNIDKDKGVMYVDARVLDYVKEYNGVEVRGQFPFRYTFEFAMDFSNQAQCKKIVDKLFKVKKGITQTTFEGEFIEGGAVIQATIDDVPDEIKELIDLGVYSEEEALAKCSANGSRERRMVLKKPLIKLVGEDKTPVVQVITEKYSEEDLILDCMNVDGGDDAPFDEDADNASDGDDMSWLDNL
jgi:hypothetical protein